MADTYYLLQNGEPHRWDYKHALALDDGYYRMGITQSYTAKTTGDYSGTTNITVNGKTEAKSNNCVLDNRTGLIWSKGPSTKIYGSGSNEHLHWDDHVDVIVHDGANGGYVAGELLTQAVTGDTAQIRYVDDTNNILGVINPSTRPFGSFANTISSPTGGPDTIQTYTEGSKEDIWSYVVAANAAEFAGFSDWRIPTVFELMSIMYYSPTNGNAEPDNTYFTMPAATTDIVWTSSHEGFHNRISQHAQFDPSAADAARFDTGLITFDTNSLKCYVTGAVYLVRDDTSGAEYPCKRFRTSCFCMSDGYYPCDAFYEKQKNREWSLQGDATSDTVSASDGTLLTLSKTVIVDNLSGITWSRNTVNTAMPFYDDDGLRLDALETCYLWNHPTNLGDVGFMGYTDWRLPTIEEVMAGIAGYWHRMSTYFTNSDREFWIATPDVTNTDQVYYFKQGYIGVADRRSGGSKYVRLVRGGTTDADL